MCVRVLACVHACGRHWVCLLKIRAAQWKDVISQAGAARGWASQGGPRLAPGPAHEVRQRPGVRARECRQGLLAKGQGVWGQDSEGQCQWGSFFREEMASQLHEWTQSGDMLLISVLRQWLWRCRVSEGAGGGEGRR